MPRSKRADRGTRYALSIAMLHQRYAELHAKRQPAGNVFVPHANQKQSGQQIVSAMH